MDIPLTSSVHRVRTRPEMAARSKLRPCERSSVCCRPAWLLMRCCRQPFRRKLRAMRGLRPLVGSSPRTQPGVESLKELAQRRFIPYDDLKVPDAMMAAMGQVTSIL